MKRAMLVDRVKLLAEKRHALVLAASEARKEHPTEFWRRQAEAGLEMAAVEYAVVLIRYLGGNR